MPPDVVAAIGNGRDNAASIGEIAERLNVTRREVEVAIQLERLSGVPICASSRGVFIGDSADLAATIASLRQRCRNQYATVRALQRTLRRMGDYEQIPLFGEIAA